MNVLQSVLSCRQDEDGLGPVAELLACVAPVPLDLIVSSLGGVGTNMMMQFLHQAGFSINLVTDYDGLKHAPAPPRMPAERAPRLALYIFGNPLLSVASHYRRAWAEAQAAKTSGRGAFQDFPQTFALYLERGEDLFGYEAALTHWLGDLVEYDILLVRYEHVFEHVEQLLWEVTTRAGRLPLDLRDLVARFPQQKKRKSEVTAAQQEMMYKNLQIKIDRLPDIFIRRAGEQLSLE
mmetsp:Transcript_37510/g.52063  ORF Transcript_37510/g.52063 Transcript_37510/m.52063 type:complete len:236 (+) Transcript_37510:93-800(+)|eukprot:CAMPEP_0196585326 /NCGR_PEP_ID=MMETSP1081-20130531/50271_1 /TAXON_ID=36882 /ORGANISM="Pyramimonas amylifera, Strain CCMP720" /LENGTH=235 /DNA_ID=CAMNT_0041906839 /DNA_START=233 /DNA_END=940 /DNA_ORIENTATION=-